MRLDMSQIPERKSPSLSVADHYLFLLKSLPLLWKVSMVFLIFSCDLDWDQEDEEHYGHCQPIRQKIKKNTISKDQQHYSPDMIAQPNIHYCHDMEQTKRVKCGWLPFMLHILVLALKNIIHHYSLTGAEPPETEASLPRWTGGDSTMRLNERDIKTIRSLWPYYYNVAKFQGFLFKE